MKPGDRRAACVFLIALGVLAFGDARARNEPFGIVQLTPDEIQWHASPTSSNGLQVVVLAGNPKEAVLYTVRIKIPANFKVQPHWHHKDRMVSVISGTLHYAYGDTFDEAKMRALPPGSFFTEPAKHPHFAWAKSGDVIVQVTAIGPTGTTHVDSSSEHR
ncbi:MAG: cupin domain-containing protein [Acidiferrobacterales bacterium]